MNKNIALIYGDCASPEIVTQAVRVLDKIAAKHGHTFTYTRAYMGGEAIDKFGDPLPASELEKCKASDSVLLGAIGVNMVLESRKKESEKVEASFSVKAMLPLAVATSIDALTVGITFAFLQVDILPAVLLIGVTTFVLSAAGVRAGSIVGMRGKSRAELLGGLVLIFLGCKILVEHLGLLG